MNRHSHVVVLLIGWWIVTLNLRDVLWKEKKKKKEDIFSFFCCCRNYVPTARSAGLSRLFVSFILCFVVLMSAWLQGGEDSKDPLSCRSFSRKEPLNIGHFCRKWPIKIRDPMSLCHPVWCIQVSRLEFEYLFTKRFFPCLSRMLFMFQCIAAVTVCCGCCSVLRLLHSFADRRFPYSTRLWQ